MIKHKNVKSTDVKKEPVQKTDKQKTEKYVLCLYVCGSSTKSTRAISNIKNICEEFLKGRYELEVIDIYQNAEVSKKENIIAAPTLVKMQPPPVKRILGDLSGKEKVLIELGLLNKSSKKE